MTDEPIAIPTDRGDVAARFTPAADATRSRAMLFVGGADGGFDGPAEALYPTLAEDLAALGIATLRVDFRLHRFPNDVEEGVHDLLAGLAWLEARGAARVVLVGHSFGGAVVIEGGVRASERTGIVAGVVTLATQTAGAQRVPLLSPRPILLMHGRADDRLSPMCSQMLHDAAGEPRELVIIEGAT
ncbi:MAG: alpha/beta fold hydrolase, partial [Chloroflexota bacterium]